MASRPVHPSWHRQSSRPQLQLSGAMWSELHVWLADRFPACSLHTISPELLAVYLTQHWLPQHAGSQLPASDDRIAAPASLAAMLSHLSSYLEHVEGRVGPYQLLPNGSQQGNPTHSSVIQRLRKGYSNKMRSKGVSQGAATPVSFDQVQQLLQPMESALNDSEPSTAAAVMIARDGFLISTLWHTALRGDNAGRLCSSDVIFDDGSSVPDFLASGAAVQPGSQLFFRPDGTKTLRAANSGRVPVDVFSSDDQNLCCIWWLQQLQLEFAAFASQPLSGYLCRPLTPCRSRFANKPMSSSSINAMLKMRQQQFGILGDITPHGFRRGRLQQLDSIGCSLSAITQHALNKTEATIQHRYLNRDAHLNSLKRARS